MKDGTGLLSLLLLAAPFIAYYMGRRRGRLEGHLARIQEEIDMYEARAAYKEEGRN